MMSRWMQPRSCKKASASNICLEMQRICGSDRPWSRSRGKEMGRGRGEERGGKRGRGEERGREGERGEGRGRGKQENSRGGSISTEALINPYKLLQDGIHTSVLSLSCIPTKPGLLTMKGSMPVLSTDLNSSPTLGSCCKSHNSSKPETSLQVPHCRLLAITLSGDSNLSTVRLT